MRFPRSSSRIVSAALALGLASLPVISQPQPMPGSRPMPRDRGDGGFFGGPPPAGGIPRVPSDPSPVGVNCRAVDVPLDAATQLPPGYERLARMKGVSVSRQGEFVVVRTEDVPDHKSPYFPVSDTRYTPGPAMGFRQNPSQISPQNYEIRIPAQPRCAERISDTRMDAIGVAVNGVVFFNQYAAGNQPLTHEMVSFDQFNGHPAHRNQYHYHLDPKHLTASNPAALIGWALDGFPVYGPKNPDGSTPQLDRCNGQFSATPEYPKGIYHYHVTDTPPYLVGCYAGTPGRWSN
jgi:YHYH protein